MKNLLFIIISILICLFCLISEQAYGRTMDISDIILRAKTENEDLRSIASVHAWLNDRTVYVGFYDVPQTVTILIISIEGEPIVANTYSSSQLISIPVNEVGKYQIEIHVDFKVYTGVFELK